MCVDSDWLEMVGGRAVSETMRSHGQVSYTRITIKIPCISMLPLKIHARTNLHLRTIDTQNIILKLDHNVPYDLLWNKPQASVLILIKVL